MPWDQQEGTLCTRTHVLSLGKHGKQDVQARRHDRSHQAQSHTSCSSLPKGHARVVYQFCASAVLECRDPTCRPQLANLWWVSLENCDKRSINHRSDLGYMINHAMFQRNGRSGYVLKPLALRSQDKSLLNKQTRHYLDITVCIQLSLSIFTGP
jgi:hypothetical protein